MLVFNEYFTVFICKSFAALTCSSVFDVFMLLQIEWSCVLYGWCVVSVWKCTRVCEHLVFSILIVSFAYHLFCRCFPGPCLQYCSHCHTNSHLNCLYAIFEEFMFCNDIFDLSELFCERCSAIWIFMVHGYLHVPVLLSPKLSCFALCQV